MTDAAAQSLPQPDEAQWPAPAYGWYVMAVIILVYSFAILDRAVISLLVDQIKSDLHVSDSQMGLLQGLAFAICFTSFGLVLGYVTDRSNRRLLLACGIVLWSTATILCGLATTFGTLFAARIGVGLGEACVLPVSMSLVADYFEPKRRAKAYGLFMLGGSAGTGLGNLLGGSAIRLSDSIRSIGPDWMSTFHNWQITFFAVGVPGFVVALILVATVREPRRREKLSPCDGISLGPVLRHVRANAAAYGAVLGGGVLNTTCIYAHIAWVPTVIMRVHGWTPAKTGTVLAAFALVGAVSAISVGWFVARLIGQGRRDAPIQAMIMQSTALALMGPLACFAPTPFVGLWPYLAMTLFTNWSSSSALIGISQITPNELRGQITAMYTLATGLVSLTLGSYSVGFLSDHVFEGATAVAPSLASVYAFFGLLGLVVLLTGRQAYCAAVQRSVAWQEKKSNRTCDETVRLG